MTRWFWMFCVYCAVTSLLLNVFFDWPWWGPTVTVTGAAIWGGVWRWLWLQHVKATQRGDAVSRYLAEWEKA